MSTLDAVVRVDGLVKHYGKVEAVRGIDLEVGRGEVFGFLGPNGSGKSTTIRCLLGLLRPTAGRIGAFGLDSTRAGVALRRRIAYVPGELRLPERVSGMDLVASIGRLRGGFDAGRRDQLADRLRLDLRRPLRDLSSGNRRRPDRCARTTSQERQGPLAPPRPPGPRPTGARPLHLPSPYARQRPSPRRAAPGGAGPEDSGHDLGVTH